MQTAQPILRRALLYVPGSSQRMLAKSQSLQVDCVAYDLEDSVTPSLKAEARQNISRILNGERSARVGENAVRINSLASGYALDDLTAVLGTTNIDTIVVPKINSASDINFVSDVIRHAKPSRRQSASPLRILALIESAKALMDLPSICKASENLSGLIFAAEDFALDLSITRTPSLSEFLFARSAIVTACRAHELPSAIDLVCTSYKGTDSLTNLEDECLGGKRLGFNGKQCIHPTQVETTQRSFAPSEEELNWAAKIIVGDEKADHQGRGAWTMDGKMIDMPVVGKAKSILKIGEHCGINVSALSERWKDQEPE